MSRTTLEMPNVLTTRVNRGLTPSTSQEWIPQKEDVAIILQRTLGQWINELSESESLFKKHVYETDNLLKSDLRQHRAWTCKLIADGEILAVNFQKFGEEIGAKKEKEYAPTIELIDQNLKKLFDSLIAWHAPLAMQTDIPESFKQAAQEVEEGKVVNLDI